MTETDISWIVERLEREWPDAEVEATVATCTAGSPSAPG